MTYQFADAIDALADSWASIDGKRGEYRAGKGAVTILDEPGGHFTGYQADAQSMIDRLRRRGWDVTPLSPAPESP
ncbi:hypothetical protein FF100_04775 [Methylobacterium terricola]|uniref:Uncharacterized protein n=1 Tax=Methylobacterium terricola TaxID=2583531 RepID=A0A5C4LPX5_9HYPH|nr:hypothetical protein [Methylobacterium terricola]TNC14892.1 hypothetical protein FF100_04775 [Methylobacterium terricola]